MPALTKTVMQPRKMLRAPDFTKGGQIDRAEDLGEDKMESLVRWYKYEARPKFEEWWELPLPF